MEPTKKNNIIKLVIIIFALLIAILILFFLAYPLYQEASNIKQQIKIKQSEEEALKLRIDQLKELEKNYKEAKEKSKVAELALPNEKQIPEILVQLENIATENGMSFLEITPGEKISTTKSATKETEKAVSENKSITTKEALYKELPLTIKISGNFAGLKNYLKGIEKNIRIFDVSAISIERSTTETQEKVLNIDLIINAYFQP